MGIKLEFVLIIAIIGIISGSLMLKLSNTTVQQQTFTKELEFTNTTFTEVDTETMKSRAYCTYGVRDKGVFILDNLEYSTDSIESLLANKARFQNDKLYLDGDVELQEKGGYRYETQHAIYHQKTEILNITAPFIGVQGQNIVQGNSLEYNTRKKKATGKTVGTVFHIPDN